MTGRYCDQDGLSAPSGLCTEGYYCSSSANTATPTDGTTGDICPPGAYCMTGSSAPNLCPPGTYNPTQGNYNICTLRAKGLSKL